MENFRSLDRQRNIDLLNEKISIHLSVTSDALANLPIISNEDNNSRRERYGALLGRFRRDGVSAIQVELAGIYQETEAEQEDMTYGSYTEGIEHVSYDLQKMKSKFNAIRGIYPEYAHLMFIGDVHTHPSGIAIPSRADLTSVISAYESGNINRSEPYIFGIGELNQNKIMHYCFYRLFATQDFSSFGYKLVDAVTTPT